MNSIYFPDEEIKLDDPIFIRFMLERIARKQHIFNRDVLDCIPMECMYHLISCAQVLHCENPEKVEDEWIEEYNIP